MTHKLFKNLAALAISAILVISISFASFAAAVKTTNAVTTDRTIQDRQTGVLTYNEVTVPHYATSVVISGKVVIDGPKLILKVNGVDVTDKSNVIKVADKTWTYSFTYGFNNAVGDVPIKLEAYTVYISGQPAGNIHTSAAPVTQTVHVPFVKGFSYTSLTWDSYDRNTNIFTFSYNLVKVWDDGVIETAAVKTTATVEGTQSFTIPASDPTYNNGAPASAGTVAPPVVFRNFTFPATASGYTWTYNANGTYSVSFMITKLWSNGTTTVETRTIDGLAPSGIRTISVTVEGVTNTAEVAVPAAPVITVTKAVGIFVSKVTIAENDKNSDKISYNNYKVTNYVKVSLSDGTEFTSENFEVTFPFNSGSTELTRTFTKTFTINGKDYDVTYQLTFTVRLG